MRLVIAQMAHETNTFLPVPMPLARAQTLKIDVGAWNGTAVRSADDSALPFHRLRRPVYPMDPL